MSNQLTNLLVSTVGSVIAAAVIYWLGRLTFNRPTSAVGGLGNVSPSLESLQHVNASDPPGPVARAYRFRVFLSSSLASLLLVFLDLFHSAIHVALEIVGPYTEPPHWVLLRGEAEHALQMAQLESDRLTREAQLRASQIIDEAGRKEEAYRLKHQPKAAAATLAIAQDEAARVLSAHAATSPGLCLSFSGTGLMV